MRERVVAIGAILVAGSLLPAAVAQDAAATVECQPQMGRLFIEYFPSLAQAEGAVKERKPLVFHDLLKVDKDSTLVDTSAKTYSCKLKHDAVVVTLEAGIFDVNEDLLGLCGDVTGVVSISRNGKVILKEQAFEDLDCAKERRIRSITVHDGSAKVDIVWTSYDE
jgi:hypothetical protein